MRWSRRKKWVTGIALAVVVLAAIGYWNRTALALWGFDMFFKKQVEKRLEDSYRPLKRNVDPVPVKSEPREERKKPFTLLLLGVDQRGEERGRSDTMIMSVVRPSDGAALMVSIPRDAYVEIPGRDRDKITHAYAYGEADLAVETVEHLFGIPVDHYAAINFQGFREAVDYIGGIELPIEKDMVNDDPYHEKFVIRAGKPVYNGEEALNYVRYREDGGGDISRTMRQQIFLQAVLDKAAKVGQWTRIPGLIDIMGDNFATDITPSELIEQAKTILTADARILYSHTLKGEGRRLSDGLWYFMLDEADLARATEWIEAWLDPSKTLSELPKPGDAETASANTAAGKTDPGKTVTEKSAAEKSAAGKTMAAETTAGG